MSISSDDPAYNFRVLLAQEIVRSLGPKSQHVIAPHFGIRQPRMSELARGKVERCSMEWLIRRIYRMGGSVNLTVALGDVRRAWSAAACRRMRGAASSGDGHTGPWE
jgi:predicted XRE-type DNA-binding protein